MLCDSMYTGTVLTSTFVPGGAAKEVNDEVAEVKKAGVLFWFSPAHDFWC